MPSIPLLPAAVAVIGACGAVYAGIVHLASLAADKIVAEYAPTTSDYEVGGLIVRFFQGILCIFFALAHTASLEFSSKGRLSPTFHERDGLSLGSSHLKVTRPWACCPISGSIAISATDAATMPLPISATRLHRWQWLVGHGKWLVDAILIK